MVQAYGRKTTKQRKIEGVKQGCPFSPNLFVLVPHAILETVTEALGNYDLSGSCLTLPFILGYADDLLILADNLEFTYVASEVGLHLNPQKCEIMLRNPHCSSLASNSQN